MNLIAFPQRFTGLRFMLAMSLCLLLGAATFMVHAQNAVPREGKLRDAILGQWCASEDEGKTCWAYNDFRPDGTFRSEGAEPSSKEAFVITGRFETQGQLVCHTITSNSSSLWPNAGTTACSKILSINKTLQVFKQLHDGRTHVFYRTNRRKPAPA